MPLHGSLMHKHKNGHKKTHPKLMTNASKHT